MKWKSVIFSSIITLLYIPLVFMGTNVFFPEYTDYYHGSEQCMGYPGNEKNATEYEKCWARDRELQESYQKEKRDYDSKKYVFITAVSLLAMLSALFLLKEQSVVYGLFIGSVLSSFFSTWIYFDTKSRLGFSVLVLIFIASIYFIMKRK
jgi:hypothetical protein